MLLPTSPFRPGLASVHRYRWSTLKRRLDVFQGHSYASSLSRIADEIKINILSATQDVDNKAEMQKISRTFISDTKTAPTPQMMSYASRATLGDDVYNDLSTSALEAHVAQLAGKEAGLLMASGTMSNQIALRTWLTQPPYSVLVDKRSHIYRYEASGAAFHSGATAIAVLPSNWHHLTLADVQQNVVLESDIHYAPTAVVALENTLNGTIIPQDEAVAISDWVHSKGMMMHLDGARLWHVAVQNGMRIKELCDPFDSVSLCLSKGLGAPIGSILVGPSKFINKARHFRKLFGGGMRQTGYIAACGAYALTHNFAKLRRVHELAKVLEKGLEEVGCVITSRAETCTIFYDPSPIGLDYAEIHDRAAALPEPIELGGSRMVVHIQTSEAAIDDFLNLIRTMAEEKLRAGFMRKTPVERQRQVWQDPYVRRTKNVC